MYISKSQAIREVRSATGLSKALVTARVQQLPVRIDGLREKVSRLAVSKLIRELNEPLPSLPDGIRVKPLSAKHKAQIRAAAITKQVIEKLQTSLGGHNEKQHI